MARCSKHIQAPRGHKDLVAIFVVSSPPWRKLLGRVGWASATFVHGTVPVLRGVEEGRPHGVHSLATCNMVVLRMSPDVRPAPSGPLHFRPLGRCYHTAMPPLYLGPLGASTEGRAWQTQHRLAMRRARRQAMRWPPHLHAALHIHDLIVPPSAPCPQLHLTRLSG
jgi:hypothetical protein